MPTDDPLRLDCVDHHLVASATHPDEYPESDLPEVWMLGVDMGVCVRLVKVCPCVGALM